MSVVSRLSPNDLNEMKKVSVYAAQEIKKLQELSNDFADPSTFKMFWDSKIPKEDKRWYYFFSLKYSDPEYVRQEIKKYKDFYVRLSDVIKKTELERDTDCVEHCNKISALIEELSELDKKAKLGENSTSSKIVYKLHKFFIQEYEKLENMMKRVKLITVTDGWEKSAQAMITLKNDMEIWKKNIFEEFSERNKVLLEINKEMQQRQEKLLEENKKRQQAEEKLLAKTKEMQEKQQDLLEAMEQMKKEHQETLLKSNKEVLQQREELLKSNEEMQKKQKELMESIEQMKKEHQETLLKSNEEMQQQRKELLKSNTKVQQQQIELTEFIKQMQQQQEKFLKQQEILLQENTAMKSKLETMPHPPDSNGRTGFFIY